MSVRVIVLVIVAVRVSDRPALDLLHDPLRQVFEGLQHGKIDRSLFTENGSAYFTDQTLADFASSLGPLGTPQEFTPTGQTPRGGMIFRSYRVKFASKTANLWVREMPDGKIEEFQVMAAD